MASLQAGSKGQRKKQARPRSSPLKLAGILWITTTGVNWSRARRAMIANGSRKELRGL